MRLVGRLPTDESLPYKKLHTKPFIAIKGLEEEFERKPFLKRFPLKNSNINYIYSPIVRFAAVRVFCISIVMVIGPTPPGTGVI